MNCPECGKKMEQENCPFVTSIENVKDQFSPEVHKMDATHYRCDTCDTEWTRISRGKLRMLDGAETPIRTHKVRRLLWDVVNNL